MPIESPTMSPTDSPTVPPTESPTAAPTPAATPEPTPTPTPAPTATPDLSAVRLLPLGTEVTIRGRLTTPIGLLDGGTIAFIEDASAGIALELDSADWLPFATGTDVVASGALASRDGLLVVQLGSAASIAATGSGPLPDPMLVVTGLACEAFEARLIVVEGWITALPSITSDGVAIVVDDGTGPLKAVASSGTGIGSADLLAGSRVRLTGVLSQRGPTSSGAGYELLLRSIDDVV